jgi:hypothetical protein
MAASNKTAAKVAVSLERQQRALELRRAGLDYRSIASKLGIGKSQAQRLVKGGMEGARAQIDAEASDLKAEELSRLDGMLAGLWADARKGHLGAIDRVLKIGERRAKLLGLDAPVKMAHGGDADAPPIKQEHAFSMTDEALERIASSGSP